MISDAFDTSLLQQWVGNTETALVSRVARLQAPIDSDTASLDDRERGRVGTGRARTLGFGGEPVRPSVTGPDGQRWLAPDAADLTLAACA